jgi:crossover junction endodeoxyribonuclease RusA
MIINLNLPWPPSANRYWRNLLGRTVVSREAKEYKEVVKKLVLVNRLKMMEGRLCLTIHAYPPDNRRRDLDNLIKIVADSLQDAGLFADDSQIDCIVVKRMPEKIGEIFVEVREIE